MFFEAIGRIRMLVMLVALVGLVVFSSVIAATAAPLSGSFQTDIVLRPFSCGVDQDGDTFIDEDPENSIDDDQDGRIDEDDCLKVDDTVMKFEADLVLLLNISGLQISSTTVFTFKGLEYQAFTISSTIGAVSIKDTFVFAPSITEIEQIYTTTTLFRRYCVSASAPGDVTPPFLECPVPDSVLYWLLEDPKRFHPAVANLRLAGIFDSAGMLDSDLAFRKKIAEFSINIAGISLSGRLLFANLGSVTAPDFRTGAVLAIEGQTVSGIIVRAESWFGAREGLECFAECKPIERIYSGIVVSDLSIQEETLSVRNLTLGGVNFSLKTEFNFFTAPGTYCPVQGICYIEITSRGRLLPMLTILESTWRLNSSLNPASGNLKTQLRFGDVAVTTIWYFYPVDAETWESQIAEFISVFDPPGVTITSDLRVCTEELFAVLCSVGHGTLQHDIFVNAVVSNASVTARIVFLGIIDQFYQFSVDTSFRVGQVIFTGAIVLSPESLDALAFSTRIEF